MCDFALIALFFLSSAVLEAMLAGSKLLLFRGLESGEPYMTSANLSHLWTPLSLSHSRNRYYCHVLDNPLPPLVRDTIFGRSAQGAGQPKSDDSSDRLRE